MKEMSPDPVETLEKYKAAIERVKTIKELDACLDRARELLPYDACVQNLAIFKLYDWRLAQIRGG